MNTSIRSYTNSSSNTGRHSGTTYSNLRNSRKIRILNKYYSNNQIHNTVSKLLQKRKKYYRSTQIKLHTQVAAKYPLVSRFKVEIIVVKLYFNNINYYQRLCRNQQLKVVLVRYFSSKNRSSNSSSNHWQKLVTVKFLQDFLVNKLFGQVWHGSSSAYKVRR